MTWRWSTRSAATRATSSVATGIEDSFLTAYRDGSFQYLLIAAARV